MVKQLAQNSVFELRQKHPKFIYENYSWSLQGSDLIVSFSFKIEPDIVFNPYIKIQAVNPFRLQEIKPEIIENLVFNLGLVEMISYWKAACSPAIEIRPSGLDDVQTAWWKDLIINGLGEFFFVNKIDFRTDDFLTVKADQTRFSDYRQGQGYDDSEKVKDILVLTSGGKDTALTLSILKNENLNFSSVLLNPTKAALDLTEICGAEEAIIIERNIDSKLLELNKLGYLNGHTPFSAYLGFLSVFTAILFGYKNVLVSNERSSNEGNLSFLGREINHQYSKTLEFERKFQKYVYDYISSRVNYFSFLRPLYEIQIAAMLTKFKEAIGVFRSCNRNYKENTWCGNCPKCLAVYIMIYPFTENGMIKTIFGKEPFNKKDNIKIVNDLMGFGTHKPFECVGTHEETIIGLFKGLKKAKEEYTDLPKVWKYLDEHKILEKFQNLPDKVEEILTAWDENHCLPLQFEALLKKYQ
jgi:UDP-N-acetyl-alpha-D-muramoyl-L-alanyl-L-glutamate epimerase